MEVEIAEEKTGLDSHRRKTWQEAAGSMAGDLSAWSGASPHSFVVYFTPRSAKWLRFKKSGSRELD